MKIQKTSHQAARRPDREQRGWVLIATLFVGALAASLTVGWARHAVLAKGKLEMATGASRTEEACRSGFDRCRAKMRHGLAPGDEAEGEQDVAITEDGDQVTVSRKKVTDEDDYDKREVKVRTKHESGNAHKDAALKGRASVVPGNNSKGVKTRLTCDAGAKVLLIPGLTMVTGDLVFTPSSTVTGVYLLEDGARVVLEDNVVEGCFVTRSSLCEDNPVATGSSRPRIEMKGGCKIKDNADFPGLSMCGPDLVISAATTARLDIAGMIVADDVDLPCRGTLRGMVVTEHSESLSSAIARPGHGRGAVKYPKSVEPGSERMTRLAFPTERCTDAEYDAMETYDVEDLF